MFKIKNFSVRSHRMVPSSFRMGYTSSLWLWANKVDTHAEQTADEGEHLVPLQRDQVLLVVLSLADGSPLTPVQVQKSLFLADDKASDAFQGASRYNFQPYDYGPFDRQVYIDAQTLSHRGLVEIGTDARGGWNTYAATDDGVRAGKELVALLTDEQRSMLSSIVKLVRSLSFTELVSAIYRRHPEMPSPKRFQRLANDRYYRDSFRSDGVVIGFRQRHRRWPRRPIHD